MLNKSAQKKPYSNEICRILLKTRNRTNKMNNERYIIHDIPVTSSNYTKSVEDLNELVNNGKGHYICFLESNLLYRTLKDKELLKILNQADRVYPDGTAITKSVFLLKRERINRISGPTFFLNALQFGVNKHWRHFFYGGGDGVAETLAKKMKERFPGVEIVGTHSPPFRPLTNEEETNEIKMINDNHADIIWVGLGGPKQEYWMHKHREEINASVMLGVGAAFDFHSGSRMWAPRWVRFLGMEWFFRMLLGGKRVFFRNIRCVSVIFLMLAKDCICGLFQTKKQVAS